jgi:hypothetical protein
MNIKIDVCAMFKIKYGVNTMQPTIFLLQVGWFDGKGIHIHLWAMDQTS